MKLQFNTKGAWKDVLELPELAAESDIALTTIVEAASNLLEACSSRASFRVVDDKLVVLIWDDLGRKDFPYGRAA